jgi:hypothetical protein
MGASMHILHKSFVDNLSDAENEKTRDIFATSFAK